MQETKRAQKKRSYPPPKLTRTGVRVLLQYVALPVLLMLTLIDVVLYLIFRFGFDSCYGVICLIG